LGTSQGGDPKTAVLGSRDSRCTKVALLSSTTIHLRRGIVASAFAEWPCLLAKVFCPAIFSSSSTAEWRSENKGKPDVNPWAVDFVTLPSCRNAEYLPWPSRILTTSVVLGHAGRRSSSARLESKHSRSHREILEFSLFTVVNGERSRRLFRWSETTHFVATTTWPPEIHRRNATASRILARRTSAGFQPFPSSLHAKETLHSGVSPLDMHENARETSHVRFRSPGGLGDVQVQDALKPWAISGSLRFGFVLPISS